MNRSVTPPVVHGPASSALYAGRVEHHRLGEPAHRFSYALCAWWLDLDELPALGRRIAGFGHNRARPIAFHDRDHLRGGGEPLRDQLRRILADQGFDWPGGSVRVLTQPRVIGYVFNPVSFWYCFTPEERLDAIVAEVNNTFGERHCYVWHRRRACRDETGRLDTSSTWARWTDKKVFHVSPFFTLDGTYAFALESPAERLRVRIGLSVGGETRFVASLSLRRELLRRGTVLAVLARYPLMTMRIIGAIHWQALRLWRKGATYHPKPPHDPEAAREGAA